MQCPRGCHQDVEHEDGSDEAKDEDAGSNGGVDIEGQ